MAGGRRNRGQYGGRWTQCVKIPDVAGGRGDNVCIRSKGVAGGRKDRGLYDGSNVSGARMWMEVGSN